MKGLSIIGTGMYVPQNEIKNDDFIGIVETSDEWITTRTGIKTRHVTDGELNWQMGVKSASLALKDAGVTPDEIDLVIHTSVSPDYSTPSMACVLAGELGIKNTITYDINCACAGYVHALDMARMYMQGGEVKTALIISSEQLSKLTDYSDRTTCVLFGDGSASTVVKASDSIFSASLGTDGSGWRKIYARGTAPANVFFPDSNPEEQDGLNLSREHYIHMDGREVYKFATKVIPSSLEDCCEKAGITVADLDLIIPHQANYRIIETAAKALNIPIEKFYLNIESYGNTSSASIPIALDEVRKAGKIKKGDKICFVGFGAGLTYGACVLEY